MCVCVCVHNDFIHGGADYVHGCVYVQLFVNDNLCGYVWICMYNVCRCIMV